MADAGATTSTGSSAAPDHAGARRAAAAYFTAVSPGAGSTVPVLIDLDAAPAPRPPASRPRWLAPLLAVSLLLPLGGAAGPGSPGEFRTVAVADGPLLAGLLTESMLVTAVVVPENEEPVDAAGEGVDYAEVRALPLAPGGPAAWAARLAAPNSDVQLSRAGDAVVVRTVDDLTVLDARTGQPRWREAAHLVTVVGDRAVRSEWDDDDGTTTFVDLASGRPLWRSDGIADFAGRDEAGRYVVTLDMDGRVTALDAASGRILAARTVDVQPAAYRPALSVVGDRVYLFRGSGVLALRLPDLATLWQIRAAVPAAVQGCGPLVCVTDQRGLTAVVPATGEVRWRGEGWISYADGVAVAGTGHTVRLDPVTGRVLEELGRGTPAGDLMLRSERGRMWVTRLRSGELLGTLPAVVPSGCDAFGTLLGCETRGWSYTVWRLPVRARPSA